MPQGCLHVGAHVIGCPHRPAARFGKSSVAMPAKPLSGLGLEKSGRFSGVLGSVWARSGERGSVGRCQISFPVFGLLAPNSALRWIENPRVDGSIPSLATTFNFLICKIFRDITRGLSVRGPWSPSRCVVPWQV